MVRAKCDDVVCLGTSSDAGWVVVSVRVSFRASDLEDFGVSRRFAREWVTEQAGTTVLWRVEGRASAFTGYDPFPVT